MVEFDECGMLLLYHLCTLSYVLHRKKMHKVHYLLNKTSIAHVGFRLSWYASHKSISESYTGYAVTVWLAWELPVTNLNMTNRTPHVRVKPRSALS